jgi:hypothetical protein
MLASGDSMRELWKAFLARLVYWLTPKPVIPPTVVVQAPEPPLKPGNCECDHMRCSHVEGKGKCTVMYAPKSEHNHSDVWTKCACNVYIPDDDDDDSDDDPETPSPSELERLYRK